MKKLESLRKKAKNVDVKAVYEGVKNKLSGELEELAIERAEICRACDKNVEEPIDSLKIKDEKLPHISERCCDVCGCALPYLLRQLEESCSLKKW